MTLNLSPQIETRLTTTARQLGLDPAALIEQILEEHLASATTQTEDPTLALFDQWDKEDAARTPEQIEADERIWNEFEQGINASRQQRGMRLLVPRIIVLDTFSLSSMAKSIASSYGINSLPSAFLTDRKTSSSKPMRAAN